MRETREERCETVDAGREHEAARLYDAQRFPPRLHAIVAFDEVVERTEEQHRVELLIGVRQRSGVAESRRHRETLLGQCGRSLDVARHQIDDLHLVTRLCEPARVHAGRAAHIEDPERVTRQHAFDDLARAQELELVEAGGDPRGLVVVVLVMVDDLGIDLGLVHRTTAYERETPRGMELVLGRGV